VIDPATQFADSSCSSVIYKDEKVFDQPKRAVYGIQPANPKF
jgi:hypothetical protein